MELHVLRLIKAEFMKKQTEPGRTSKEIPQYVYIY